MSNTAHRSKARLKEHIESNSKLKKKAKKLAELFRNSKHVVLFTGAGISTSSGIPDYRGPEGVWTLMDSGKTRKAPTVSMMKAIPTFCHMSINKLIEENLVHFVVSQNCDGMHRKSGLPKDKISELHGNANLEFCKKCKKDYLRDFDVCRFGNHVYDHRTGRLCDNEECKGVLHDSIINFGENLNSKVLGKAKENSKKADLYIVIGSSLTVSPANKLPLMAKKKKNCKYVIINLQKTDHDKYSDLRIFGKSDEIFKLLMEELKLVPDQFSLKRKLRFEIDEKKKLKVVGLDYVDSLPYDFIKEIRVPEIKKTKGKKPFVFDMSKLNEDETETMVQFRFFSHYGEPQLQIPVSIKEGTCVFDIFYYPMEGRWKIFNNLKEIKPELHLKKKEKKNMNPYEMRLEIGNTANFHHKGADDEKVYMYYKWKLFVKNVSSSSINKIEKVVFRLHETFVDPIVEIVEKPFEIERNGWGVFSIPITVYVKGKDVKQVLNVVHELSFKDGGNKKVYQVDLKKK